LSIIELKNARRNIEIQFRNSNTVEGMVKLYSIDCPSKPEII